MLAKGMAAVNMDRMNKQSSQKKRKFGEVSSESKAQESADDGDSDDPRGGTPRHSTNLGIVLNPFYRIQFPEQKPHHKRGMGS